MQKRGVNSNAIFMEIARAAKEDKLYSSKTTLGDIADNLYRQYYPLYLRKLDELGHVVPTDETYQQRRAEAAKFASLESSRL